MKRQIVIIHGGHALDARENLIERLIKKPVTIEDFKRKKSWRGNLEETLGDDFEFFFPKMPNKESAKYDEWKTWFEKLTPFINDDVTLIGHSLGGLFLLKFLSENTFSKKIRALMLVAAPYEGKDKKHALNDNFFFNNDLSKVASQAKDVYIFHSEDDHIVPFSDFELYKEKLPQAQATTFNDRGHFNTEEFPELRDIIKQL